MAKTQPQLMSRADLAKRAGVSRAAVTKACKGAGALVDACVDDRVDVRHPAAKAYLEKHGAKAPVRPKDPQVEAQKRVAREPDAALDSADPMDADELDRAEPYASMTLTDLIDRFGSRRAFKDYLEALKKIEDIRKTRLDNDETEGELISRELVRVKVFGALEAGNRRLLMDLPKTAARMVYASVKSGASVEEVERTLRGLVSAQLKPIKTRAARELRGA